MVPISNWDYRRYMRFAKQFLRANGFRVRKMRNASVYTVEEQDGSVVTKYKCKCGNEDIIISANMLALAYKGIILKCYVALCDKCKKAYILDALEVDALDTDE